jgi:DNA ligase-1
MKPMLAVAADTNNITLPVLFSPKLDGIRALIIDGVVMSRKLKPIPNAHVQSLFGNSEYNGFDGELIVGAANAPDVYRQTNSGVMSKDGEPDVRFHIFDRFDRINLGFTQRYGTLPRTSTVKRITLVPHHLVSDLATLLALETKYLEEGYEGGMLRKPDGPYKFGRSTLKEGTLLKLKRFIDEEFEVVGFEERMHNGNEATKDELGRTKRSSHQENKTGRGDLGALVLKFGDTTFNCGTGFDDALRAEIWNNREGYMGKMVKVKHFAIGAKDLPRFPVYISIRHPDDMS